MEQPLRILVIEDSPADFLLIQRQLRLEGLIALCSRVDKLADLELLLCDAGWDLVLSDYSVPGLDFRAVFDLVHGRFPDLPLILISGNIGEEEAVELLKQGVADFVLKDRIIRLVPAIRRCLKATRELRARRAAEMALRESNERFRMIFENSIDGIMLTQLDGTVLTANPEACRIFGMDEEQLRRAGRPGLVDMSDERVHAMLEQRTQTGYFRGEITMLRGDGTPFPAEISSSIFYDQTGELKNSVIVRDVAERRSLEAQLRQSQKMEDIGTLAGGIAHDFNNILTAIVGYSTLLHMDNHIDGVAREYVNNLVSLVERASQLTRSLLAFSRNQVMTPRRINLNDVIKTITKLINRLIGEHIAVETDLWPEPLPIMADSGQIEQVLMNLATNARDAMPSGGTLTITTSLVQIATEEFHGPDSPPPGSCVLLTVRDTGTGMDEATATRIFEPFFTTKETGRGTGLGLSVLYGIIRQHNGSVTVDSSPGRGTTFLIHLPLAADLNVQENAGAPPALRGGTETILIAEDDPAILSVTSHILGQFGYGVVEARDGIEAVSRFQHNREAISLVILDMILPRKNGRDVFELIRRSKPGTKVLFVSGYPADFIKNKSLLPEGATWLQKPVSPMELLTVMRRLLDSP